MARGKKKPPGSPDEAVRQKFRGMPAGRASDMLSRSTSFISTGSLSLDRLSSGFNPGGFPLGRVIHLPGQYSTGKSIIVDHLIKSTIDMGGDALVSETEGSRDPTFADAIGLDLDSFSIHRPETIPEMFDAQIEWHDHIRSKEKKGQHKPLLIAIDSLDSTQSTRQASADLTETGANMYGGGRPQELSQAMRKVVQLTAMYPTTLVMVNQIRDNVGVMFGPKQITPGGNAPHFYASLEIWLKPSPRGEVYGKKRSKLTTEQLKRCGLRESPKGTIQGRWVRANITKTKMAKTWKATCDFFIDFEKGILPGAGFFEMLLAEGTVLERDGKIVHLMFDLPALKEDRAVVDEKVFENVEDWGAWVMENFKEVLK